MHRLYLTDLDHTFLRSDLSISDYTRLVWNQKVAQSHLSIATARSYKKAMQFLQGVHFSAPLILLDGALIVQPDKKIIDMQLIDKHTGEAIIQEGAKFGIFPFIIALKDQELNESFIYPSARNFYQERLLEHYLEDDNLIEFKFSKAMDENFKFVYMGEEKELRPMAEHFKQHFSRSLEIKLAPEPYLGCYFLTILHSKADKAHGLRMVRSSFGDNLAEIIVFGDNLNDLGMFAEATKAVAVANAHEEVKRAAHLVLAHTNNEDAVAIYLDHEQV